MIPLTGFRHWIDIGRGTDAILSFETAAVVHLLLPGAPKVLTGTWRKTADGIQLTWHGGPTSLWTIAEPAAGQFVYIEVTSTGDVVRGYVTRIAHSDPTRLRS